jgi:hypothetical protein
MTNIADALGVGDGGQYGLFGRLGDFQVAGGQYPEQSRHVIFIFHINRLKIEVYKIKK